MLSKAEFDAIKAASDFDAYKTAMKPTMRRQMVVSLAMIAVMAISIAGGIVYMVQKEAEVDALFAQLSPHEVASAMLNHR